MMYFFTHRTFKDQLNNFIIWQFDPFRLKALIYTDYRKNGCNRVGIWINPVWTKDHIQGKKINGTCKKTGIT
jgi:hypothetical protein